MIPSDPSDPARRPRVAAIILNWRRPDDTVACAASVMALDYADLDLIICDNESGDGSSDIIMAGLGDRLDAINAARRGRDQPGFALDRVSADRPVAAPAGSPDARRLWVADTGRNGGYAFGNNVGIRLALLDTEVDYVWVLNNDTLVDAEALARLVDYAESDPTIGICGATVLYQGESGRIQTLGGGRFLPGRARCEQIGEGLPADTPIDAAAIEAQLDYVNGAAALIRRSLIEQVGYMDEGYFLYWEELDWATRAKGRFRLGYCPDAIVYHQVGAASGSSDLGVATPRSAYWMTRSKFRYLRLHRPGLLAIAYPLMVKFAATELAARRPRRAASILRGALGLPIGN